MKEEKIKTKKTLDDLQLSKKEIEDKLTAEKEKVTKYLTEK